jgi:hypothetical protein
MPDHLLDMIPEFAIPSHESIFERDDIVCLRLTSTDFNYRVISEDLPNDCIQVRQFIQSLQSHGNGVIGERLK